MKDNNDKKFSTERLLISVAIVLCAAIIGYNMLYKPDVQVIEITNYTQESEYIVYQSQSEEEQQPQQEAKDENVQSVIEQITGQIVNINTASKEELETLDGIGPTIAQRIIDYREAIGGFTSVEQLLDVSGIGEVKFNAIKDFVTI